MAYLTFFASIWALWLAFGPAGGHEWQEVGENEIHKFYFEWK